MPGTFQTNLANVNISDTYYGVLHAGGQNLPPTGQAQIYDGYGTLAAIRVGANCNGVTICGPLSATSLTTTSKLSASTQFDIFNLLNVLHPVGSVIFTFNSDNPGTTRPGWSGTTWLQISQGRFIVGVGTGIDSRGESKPITPGNNTGEYNHILTIDEMPGHTHTVDNIVLVRGYQGSGGGLVGRSSANSGSTGGSQAHNNTPPGFGLYVWQRTA
jgi:hypothetical protein